MSALGSQPSSRAWSVQAALYALGALSACWAVPGLGCSAGGATAAAGQAEGARSDAPLVAAQPGAWFDAYGNLTVVGAGRRLRLVLSAPIAACSPAFQVEGTAATISAAASLPFHVLNDACRERHPSILLAEESETASPSELERSYHEVARCAVADWSLTEGWIPDVVAASDPCPLALGRSWRLPRTQELQGLTQDDRQALAGALFDTDEDASFGGLLLYATDPNEALTLTTISPNAAEVAPPLTANKRARPFFGAAVRCVRDDAPSKPSVHGPPPALPGAADCLRAHRQAQHQPQQATERKLPELQKLKSWLALAERTPQLLHSQAGLTELEALLAAPAFDDLAQQARDERALTERYAELAEGLDDPAVSASERERRHAEFAHLRRRLGGQIVQGAEASSGQRTQLGAALVHLKKLLASAPPAPKRSKKNKALDYTPILTRLRSLDSGKALPP